MLHLVQLHLCFEDVYSSRLRLGSTPDLNFGLQVEVEGQTRRDFPLYIGSLGR